MIKSYSKHLLLFAEGLFLILFIASCKKDHSAPSGPKPLAILGLYEVDSLPYRRVYIPITKIGTKTVNYAGVFDTGSSGMTIDADGILPPSMITSSGITVAGDSVNVNGITVTSKQAVISYGDATGETQEYGNLAYAPVTIGSSDGSITTRRIPIFIYYKIHDVTTGKNLKSHSNDVFGVGPGTSFANIAIASPLSYINGTGITSGFKLATFNKAAFSPNGTYQSGLLTIGLLPDDLTALSGFIMHPLTFLGSVSGYSPNIPATVTYNSKTINATILFDTGTPAITNIEDPGVTSNTIALPANSTVSIKTSSGFSYQYTTTSNYNLTQIENPSFTKDSRTIFSIDFFIDNEYLMDYVNHQIGLKNN